MVLKWNLRGKDISDSLGGAVYNATLSVDVNELSYLDSVSLVESNTSLSNENTVNRMFGYSQDKLTGEIVMNTDSGNKPIDLDVSEDIFEAELEKEASIAQEIRKANKGTKLSDKQLVDLYTQMTGDGMILF